MSLKSIQPHAIVFVVGFYKTGTSLATAMMESLGLHNPADDDNPGEWGRGLIVDRYPTRESRVLRELNQRCLDRVGYAIGERDPRRLGRSLYLDMAFTALAWRERPTVVKDPALTWTLPAWVSVCRSLGIGMSVVTTYRLRNLIPALQHAAYTRSARHWMDMSTERIGGRFVENVGLLRARRIPALLLSHEELTLQRPQCRRAMAGWLRKASGASRELASA